MILFVNVGSPPPPTNPPPPPTPPTTQSPSDYMMQNIIIIFDINPVTGDEIINTVGQFEHKVAGWDTPKPSIMSTDFVFRITD